MSGESVYLITKEMRDNWLALFEELQINGEQGYLKCYAWFMGERNIIDQSIGELRSLDEVTDFDEDDDVVTLRYTKIAE